MKSLIEKIDGYHEPQIVKEMNGLMMLPREVGHQSEGLRQLLRSKMGSPTWL